MPARTAWIGVIGATALGLASGALTMSLSSTAGELVSDIHAAMTPAEPQPESLGNGVVLIEGGPSVCCEDFYAGGRLILLGVLVGGVPAAMAGVVLAALSTRAGARQWPSKWALLFQACFVFQLSNLALVAQLLAFLWPAWDVLDWHGSFLLVSGVFSAAALPRWRAVQAGVAPSAALSVTT